MSRAAFSIAITIFVVSHEPVPILECVADQFIVDSLANLFVRDKVSTYSPSERQLGEHRRPVRDADQFADVMRLQKVE